MKKTIIILFTLLLVTITAIAALDFFSAKPPLASMEQCHRTIADARETEALQYAPELIEQSEQHYALAKQELQLQNEKVFFTRNYSKLLEHLELSSAKANEAVAKTEELKANFHAVQKEKLKQVKGKLDHFQQYYAHLPLSERARKDYTNAKLKYLESEKAYDRKAYLLVDNNLNEAKRLISKSVQSAHTHLSEYFQDLPKWKKWYQETVAWTAKNKSTAIIVDKFAHTTYVYRNGKQIRQFESELGPNWIGTKLYRGDKATPEGKYKVTKLKTGRNTIYYKALLIDYPNDDDKTRYRENIRKGIIPNRGIGNLIEIHGGGGRGINWTDGCVALTNDDMDKLWAYVSVGMPVTIVGSMRSLSEINGH